ncbi:Kunitz-type protease inhibitor AXPI-I [Exaiptasia diaphana]|nr:Kunitz-type protease inhibitor AXPI-I [Exaiptasia diaphana]
MQKYDGMSVKTIVFIGVIVSAFVLLLGFSLSRGSGPSNKDCLLPKVVGPCRAAIPRYYYNSQSGKCETFTYGGCDGNKNNFATMEKCKAACHPA